ncbi:hypothetical protein HK104_005551 [Borealophlyctis nickersoniae]|nr:hypothetical protein HK104_005551 [Borealophlyctis nickersoniae]
MSSTRPSASAVGAVQTRELRRGNSTSGAGTPTMGGASMVTDIPSDIAAAPWWSPVSRWEKQWVVPAGARFGNGLVATLGARPGVIPKPSPYSVEICKWVKTSKMPPSFDSDPESDVDEPDEDVPATPPVVADTTVDVLPTTTPVDIPDPDTDVPGQPSEKDAVQDKVEIDGEESTPLDVEGTKRIVEEEFELVGKNEEFTAMDVDEVLSHPSDSVTVGHTSNNNKKSPTKTSPTSPVSPAPASTSQQPPTPSAESTATAASPKGTAPETPGSEVEPPKRAQSQEDD